MKSLLTMENDVYDWVAARRARLFGPIGLAVCRCGISANVVSVLKLACGLAAALALEWSRAGAAGLLAASLMLDMLDGVVARISGRGSQWGVFVDIATDWCIFAAFVEVSYIQGVLHGQLVTGLLCVTLAQWGLGAVRISRLVGYATCEMGLVRQIPKYLFIGAVFVGWETLNGVALVLLAWEVLDVGVLVGGARNVMIEWIGDVPEQKEVDAQDDVLQ